MQSKSCLPAWLFFAGAFAPGCSAPTAPLPRPPFQGITLRVACPTELAGSVVREYSRAWSVRQGAQVEVLRAAPRPNGAENFAADIWIVPPSEMPALAARQLLRPLPDSFRERTAFEWADILPHFRDLLLIWDRTLYALPLLGEAPVCVYRTDRLADPKAREEFQKKHGRVLAPPATWEDFLEIAEFFRSKGSVALPPLPSGAPDLDREFFALAACYSRRAIPADQTTGPSQDDSLFSLQMDFENGRPRIAGPGFVLALQLMKRLQSCRPIQSSEAPTEAFAKGTGVLCLAEARWIHDLQNSSVRDRFAVCPMPGASFYFDSVTGARHEAVGGNRVPYLGAGGFLAVVPKNAAQPEAAFDLLADLTGPEVSRQIVVEPRWGGGATRRDHLKGATVRWDGFDLNAEGTQALKDALDQTLLHPRMKNPAIRLRIPEEEKYQTVLLAEIRAALAGQKEPAAALTAVAERWSEFNNAQGPSAAAAYRLSVGLLGK